MSPRFKLNTWDWIDDPGRKRQFNTALFAVVADRYQIATRVLSFGRDQRWKRELLNWCPPDNGVRCCVDLACGTGDISFRLARKYSASCVVGIDLSKEMLVRTGGRRAPQNLTLVQSDMSATGIKDDSADLVTGGYALRNAPSLESALGEVLRILRPGGTALFLDFSRPSGRSRQRLQYLLLAAWGGLWGLILHGNPEIYAYIAKSLQRFPDREAFAAELRQQGFVDIQSRSLFCGMLALTCVRKPTA